jgi:hypothetical protein
MSPLDILNNLFFAYFYTADEWLSFFAGGAVFALIVWLLIRFLNRDA